MKFIKKSLLPLTFALAASANTAIAEDFSGYVSQIFTGPSSSTTFNTALVGMSSTNGGSVERYVFTSDSDYLNMIVNARTGNQAVKVYFASGVVNGVGYQ